MKIKFTATDPAGELYPPTAADKSIPEWYKKTKSYFTQDGKPGLDGNAKPLHTIKKCMPVFDAMTSGYLIYLCADLFVSFKDGERYYEWTGFETINFHTIAQADKYPKANGKPLPKFMSPWVVETPKGYSSLFIPPVHRDAPFQIFPGLVDTDVYASQVNFPFIMVDENFTGLIPAGTPIAQVIPIKRDSWKMEFGSEKELDRHKKTLLTVHTQFFDTYKRFWRQRKEYR